MKTKSYLIMILFVSLFHLKNYGQDYTFSHSTGAYANLTGATVVNGTTIWDDEEWTENIGFNFKFFDTSFTKVTIVDGYVYFDDFADYFIGVFTTDLQDRGGASTASPISVKLEGAAGSRIFKIEWLNAGFVDGAPGDFTSFQLWLHEGSNTISMIYGTTQVANINDAFFGDPGPYIGVGNFNDTINPYYHLEGSPANPTLKTDLGDALNGIPASGTIYTFAKTGVTGIAKDNPKMALKIYPNPCRESLNLSLESNSFYPQQIMVFDITGKKVMDLVEPASPQSVLELDVKDLNSGIYFLQVQKANEVITQRFVKQ